MSNEEENVQVVKNFFAAIGCGDKQALLCQRKDLKLTWAQWETGEDGANATLLHLVEGSNQA